MIKPVILTETGPSTNWRETRSSKMTKFSCLTLYTLFSFLLILNLFSEQRLFVNLAEIKGAPPLASSKINVDKLLLIIKSIRERLPLRANDILEAYEQYKELHEAQSALTDQYKTNTVSSESQESINNLESINNADFGPESIIPQYEEITSILEMKELQIICKNLFNVIGDNSDVAKKKRNYAPKLVRKLERAIDGLT